VLDLFEIMEVEQLKAHRLGVFKVLQDGVNSKDAAEVSPDSGRGACADGEAIILSLDEEYDKRRKAEKGVPRG
jgi:hypothetical protein